MLAILMGPAPDAVTANPLRVWNQSVRLVAGGAKFADAQAGGTFGEALAGSIADERAVEPAGRGLSEGLVEQDLAGGGCEEVGPADDLGDEGIIHDDGEFVGRDVVAVPHDEIAEIAQTGFFHGPEISVLKCDPPVIGNTEPPVDARGEFVGQRLRGITSPFGREDGFFLVRGERGSGDVFARTRAGIDPASIAEPSPGVEVKLPPVALIDRLAIPFDAKPAEILDGSLRKLRPATVRVEILDAQDHAAAGCAGALERGPERGRMADVEESGGRRRDAPEIRGVHSSRAEGLFGPSSGSVRQLAKISPSSKSSCGSMAWWGLARMPLSAYSGWQSRQ